MVRYGAQLSLVLSELGHRYPPKMCNFSQKYIIETVDEFRAKD